MAELETRKADDEDSLSFQGFADGKDPISLVSMISQALAAAEPAATQHSDIPSFEYPLPDALHLLPQQYLRCADTQEFAGETVTITLKDLFQQLGRGKVEIPVSELAFFIPLHLLYRAALQDRLPIRIPLPSVVQAVGLSVLRERTPKDIRHYDIAEFDDPFTESEASTGQAAAVIIEDEEETAPTPPAATQPPPAPPAPATSPSPAPPTPPPPKEETAPAENLLSTTAAPETPPPSPEPAADLEPQTTTPEKIILSLPLSAILPLLPETALSPTAHSLDTTTPVILPLPDVLDQLRHGKVSISAKALQTALPASLCTGPIDPNPDALLTLPLAQVVQSVGPDALRAHTPTTIREYDIARMADPFAEPAELPKFVKVSKHSQEPAAADHPGTSGHAIVEAEADMQPQSMPYTAAPDPDSEMDFSEFPGNVNINVAPWEELMGLPGTDKSIANAILEYRKQHHSFKSIFDLLKIPTITPSIFHRMTGMEAEHKRYHRRKRLAGLLKIPAAQVANLRLVSQTIASRTGFAACLISDWDGMLLAQHGLDAAAPSLAAILPKLLRDIRHTLSLVGPEPADVCSMTVGGKLFTFSAGPNVVLTAIWADNLINENGLSFLLKARKELSWLLSLRAYVGPSTRSDMMKE